MFKKMGRNIKLQYLKLIRSKGAPSIIARSFAIGMFVEFITLPTLGLAFLLLFPLIKVFRGLFSVSLIGFVMGKFLLPAFLVLNYKVGFLLVSKEVDQAVTSNVPSFFSLQAFKEKGLAFLTGSSINGIIFAVICYYVVYSGLLFYRKRKEARQYKRKASAVLTSSEE